ncbi:MAG: hypothetical protein WC735_00080 [Candidatus Paceibacterota bacterium]|jgi:adenylate kinase family enzyme
MSKEILNRILVVGDAGRGKSTLASKISEKLGIPHHSTDDFYYEVKFSKVRDRPESITKIKEIFGKKKWIVEGTNNHLIELGLHSADIIIHLKYKSMLAQWVVLIKRYFKRENETLGKLFSLMKHVFYKKYKLGDRKLKLTHSELIEPHKQKVITLSSFKEIDGFLKSL